jgi:hypothetical protein
VGVKHGLRWLRRSYGRPRCSNGPTWCHGSGWG